LLLIALLLATACAPATPAEVPAVEQPTGEPVAESPTEAPEVEQPTEAAAPSQRIVVAMDTEIDTMELDAFKSDAAYVLDANVQERPIDYQWEQGPLGSFFSTGEYEGLLAESWEVSDDGMTLTFHIRPGITFYNGDPVDAQAFAHSYERHISLTGGITRPMMDMALGAVPEGSSVDQVEVVDDSTIRLHLTRPNPAILNFLLTTVVPIIDPAVTAANATADDPWATAYWRTGTIGTGPYELTRFEPGVEWELEPYEGYWRPEVVKNDGILVKVVPSADSRLLLLKGGDVDVVWGIPLRDMKDLEEDPNFKVITFPSRSQNFVILNHTIPPFDNVLVRQAVAYAVPYKDLIEKALYGYAKPLQSPFPASMEGSDFSYWPYGDGKDYEKARELLAEAGYGDGFQTELYVLAGKQADLDTAILIQDSLAQVGIDVKLVSVSSGSFFDALYNRKVPMILHYIYTYVNDPYYYSYYCLASDGVANFAAWNNPQVDELIRQGFFEPDPAKRNEMIGEVQRLFIEDAAYINLYSADLVFATSADIQGFAAHADGHPRFWMMYRE
jgi:peptide/nickel transport system substrate-binding protein